MEKPDTRRDQQNRFRRPAIRGLLRFIFIRLRPLNGIRLVISGVAAVVGFAQPIAAWVFGGTPGVTELFMLIIGSAGLFALLWELLAHVWQGRGVRIEYHAKAARRLRDIHEAGVDAGIVAVPDSNPAEYVQRQPALDRWLRTQPAVPLQRDQAAHHRLTRRLRDHADAYEKVIRTAFWSARRAGKQFSDDAKLCLAHDPGPQNPAQQFYVGAYFDSYATNEFCTRVLISDGDTLVNGLDRTPGFPSSQYEPLRPIETSGMSNHVGISTLAISADGYLMLWRQSRKTLVGETLAVATGSGSLDDDDLSGDTADGEPRLIPTLITGMERECREESSRQGRQFAGNPIIGTRVTGYFRWIRRGGKPEFVGVSRLRVPMRDLEPNNAEVESAGGNDSDMDLIIPARTPNELATNLTRFLDDQQGNITPSCWVTAQCLRDVLDDPETAAAWHSFLFEPVEPA